MIQCLDAGMLHGAFIWAAFNGRRYQAVRLTVWLWVFGFEGMDFQILGILLIHSCILMHQAPAAAVYDTWVISNFSCYFCIWGKTKKTVLLGYSLSCSKIAYTLCALAICKFVTSYCTDEQHPRVASLALRAIHLLLAPTYFMLYDWNN